MNKNTPLCDNLEHTRQQFNLERTPAYGDCLKLARNLEDRLRQFVVAVNPVIGKANLGMKIPERHLNKLRDIQVEVESFLKEHEKKS